VTPTELPYFRFFHNDWMGGLISRQPREIQGFFIDLCAIYWKQQCNGDIKRIKAYIPDFDKYIQTCFDIGIVEEKGKKILIKFLKKQREDLIKKSRQNSKNVSKRKDRKGLGGNEKPTKGLRTAYETSTFSDTDTDTDTDTDSDSLYKKLQTIAEPGKAFSETVVIGKLKTLDLSEHESFFNECQKLQRELVGKDYSPCKLDKLVDKVIVKFNLSRSGSSDSKLEYYQECLDKCRKEKNPNPAVIENWEQRIAEREEELKNAG